MIHAVKNFVANDQGPAALPKVVEVHNQQPESPTFTQDQGLTQPPNGTAPPNGHHGVSTKAATGPREMKAQRATSSKTIEFPSPKPTMSGIVRGGKDVEESFQRFLRNQNPQLGKSMSLLSYRPSLCLSTVAINIIGNATLVPKPVDAARSNGLTRRPGTSTPLEFNLESVPFTLPTSVTLPSGTLNPFSELFVPAGRTQPSENITSTPTMSTEGKKPLHSRYVLFESSPIMSQSSN